MSFHYDPSAGIPVPEYGLTIPWRITRPDLFDLIPRDRFETCLYGASVLRFTLFGYTAPFWFNFVTQATLSEVQLFRWKPRWRALKPDYRESAQALRGVLGPPDRLDQADGQLWHFPAVRVENSAVAGRRPPNRPLRVYRHLLSVALWPEITDGRPIAAQSSRSRAPVSAR